MPSSTSTTAHGRIIQRPAAPSSRQTQADIPASPTQPIRPSPRRDGSSAPFLGCGVAHGLGEFPAVAAQVLEDARALAVLVRPQLLDNARTAIACAGERRIDVWHAHLQEVRNGAIAWRNLIATN